MSHNQRPLGGVAEAMVACQLVAHLSPEDLDRLAATKIMGWKECLWGDVDPDLRTEVPVWAAERVYASVSSVCASGLFMEARIDGEPTNQDGCVYAFHPSSYAPHARMLLKELDQRITWIELMGDFRNDCWTCALCTQWDQVPISMATTYGEGHALTLAAVAAHLTLGTDETFTGTGGNLVTIYRKPKPVVDRLGLVPESHIITGAPILHFDIENELGQ